MRMRVIVASAAASLAATSALAADSTPTVDLAPAVMAGAHVAAVIILAVLSWWAKGHVQDQAARQTLLTAAENAVSYAINRVDGAVAGQALTVPVGSSVAAMALRYVLEQVPDAAARLGLDDKKIANIVVAKLPGVNGPMDDATINGIVASATGKAPAATDFGALAGVLGPMLEQAVEAAVAKHYPGKPATAPPA